MDFGWSGEMPRIWFCPNGGSDEFKFLARRLGYTEGDWEKNAKQLNDLIHFHMEYSHQFFKKRFEDA